MKYPIFFICCLTVVSGISFAQERKTEQAEQAQDVSGQQKVVKECTQCHFIDKRDDANFCIHCGSKLTTIRSIAVLVCPSCHRPLDKDGSFCAFCGQKGTIVYRPLPEKGSPERTSEPPSHKGGTEEVESPQDQGPNVPYEPPFYETETHKQPQVPTKSPPVSAQKLIYPGCEFLEKQMVQEGLPHTAQHRTISRRLYICPDGQEEVEIYYRKNFAKLAMMKVSHYDILRMLQLKGENARQNIEIALYSFVPGQAPTLWESKHRQLTKRLNEEARLQQELDKEISTLEDLCKQGKIQANQIEERVQDLKRRREIAAQAPSYWYLSILDKVMTQKKNILVITVVTKK